MHIRPTSKENTICVKLICLFCSKQLAWSYRTPFASLVPLKPTTARSRDTPGVPTPSKDPQDPATPDINPDDNFYSKVQPQGSWMGCANST